MLPYGEVESEEPDADVYADTFGLREQIAILAEENAQLRSRGGPHWYQLQHLGGRGGAAEVTDQRKDVDCQKLTEKERENCRLRYEAEQLRGQLFELGRNYTAEVGCARRVNAAWRSARGLPRLG